MWNKLYMMKKKSLTKLLRWLSNSSYILYRVKYEWIAWKFKHHKWQRSECGWKCFNLRTHILTNNCWLVFNNWSYVDSLGLNACNWVALRTGMNLFLWYGLVLFRLDETTNICIQIHIYLYKALVIMKWFHLTCCEIKMLIYLYI